MSTITRVLQDAATAEGDGLPLHVQGTDTAVVTLTLTGTAVVTFEVQQRADGDWTAVQAVNLSNDESGSTAEASGAYRVTVSALYALRSRISDYTDGEVTAVASGTPSSNLPPDQATALADYTAALAAAEAGEALLKTAGGVEFGAVGGGVVVFADLPTIYIIEEESPTNDFTTVDLSPYHPLGKLAVIWGSFAEMEGGGEFQISVFTSQNVAVGRIDCPSEGGENKQFIVPIINNSIKIYDAGTGSVVVFGTFKLIAILV